MVARSRGDGEAKCEGSPGLVVTLAIALATPAALGVETLLRVLLLPPEIAQLREDLRPTLTPLAWGLVALTCVAAPLGFAARSAMERRLLAKAEATPKKRAEAAFEAMFVGVSVPQIPALLSTLALTAGAEALPVLAAVGVSAAAVVVIAHVRPRGGSSAAAG